ncbi:6-phospho-beta-glucosidase [Embleya scabrispora]|uniref:6-phospho-beta-glucosidase n=1 Tax=Embleya scabrispora TaxID=159449 RepID=UPI000375B92E|nr:6-phospho-beta-glucosidase [Embleya scabrispora]MYS87682.1 6-phospho-beta-glucosidase [Streptomyces sp. SID5474]
MKLAVVGGGSTYTPELADGLGRLRETLPVDELVLVDPVIERLEPVGAVVRRILARYGHPARVVLTDDLDAGVEDADAVLFQLRVGGQEARAQDEEWPLDCGCVGQETTGAGGLAKALRTVPVVLDAAERVRRAAPNAWIVDFTNPVGIVTRALLDAGHRAVGLCNVAIGFQRRFAAMLDVAPNRLRLDHVGLNHLTWERGLRVLDEHGEPGPDLLPTLLAEHGPAIAEDIELPVELLRAQGTVPSYYLRYFYAHDAVVSAQRHTTSRAQQVAAIERELLELYADPTLDTKPELLERRGGAYYSEAAVALVAALLGTGSGSGSGFDGADRIQVADVRNNGTLPFLPDDAVIEVPSRIDANGATPLPVAPLGPLHSGLIAHVAAYEELALDAALRGGRDRVVTALLAHPLVGQYDIAEALTDRLLAAGKEHLPWAR